jgi:hypothetical protein
MKKTLLFYLVCVAHFFFVLRSFSLLRSVVRFLFRLSLSGRSSVFSRRKGARFRIRFAAVFRCYPAQPPSAWFPAGSVSSLFAKVFPARVRTHTGTRRPRGSAVTGPCRCFLFLRWSCARDFSSEWILTPGQEISFRSGSRSRGWLSSFWFLASEPCWFFCSGLFSVSRLISRGGRPTAPGSGRFRSLVAAYAQGRASDLSFLNVWCGESWATELKTCFLILQCTFMVDFCSCIKDIRWNMCKSVGLILCAQTRSRLRLH